MQDQLGLARAKNYLKFQELWSCGSTCCTQLVQVWARASGRAHVSCAGSEVKGGDEVSARRKAVPSSSRAASTPIRLPSSSFLHGPNRTLGYCRNLTCGLLVLGRTCKYPMHRFNVRLNRLSCICIQAANLNATRPPMQQCMWTQNTAYDKSIRPS